MLYLVLLVLFIPPVANLSCCPSRIPTLVVDIICIVVDFQEGMRGGNSRKTLNRSEECKGDTADVAESL